jgi:tetratricopeptide (TPR) repeat protein
VWILLVVAIGSFSLVSDSFATDILVEFDKSEYDTGDELTLTGFIPEFTMPIVAVSIYDPNGTILSANNLEIDQDGLFSKTFSLDSPFYDTPGKYTVKIDYKKISQEEFFLISGQESSPDLILEDVIEPEIILLTTEKEAYTDGDTVKISGIVSTFDSPTVLIGIYDPFGTPAGFYFGTIDDNLEFSTSFLAKAGVNFKIDGIYSIKAHYAEKEISTNFEFYEKTPQPIDDTPQPIDDTPQPIDDTPQPIDDTPQPIDDTPQPIGNDNEKKNSNKDNSIIQTEPKENPKKNESTSVIKETTQSKENTPTPKEPKPKSDNLSVEDVELGKLLNQINLNCDRSKYTDTISYYDGMGPALYRLCKFDSSIEFFSESLSKDPNNVEILTNKGSALGKLGYHNEAILHYDRALSIDPNFFPALNNKANSFAVMGDYEEAITLYSKALGKNPNYYTARQNLELVLSEMPQNIVQPINQQNPKSIPQTNHQDFFTDTKQTFSSKEKPEDLFEQLGSMFSSLGSLLGISN